MLGIIEYDEGCFGLGPDQAKGWAIKNRPYSDHQTAPAKKAAVTKAHIL